MGNCCSDEVGHGGAHPVGTASAQAASAAADRFLRSRSAGASTQIEVRSPSRTPNPRSILVPRAVGPVCSARAQALGHRHCAWRWRRIGAAACCPFACFGIGAVALWRPRSTHGGSCAYWFLIGEMGILSMLQLMLALVPSQARLAASYPVCVSRCYHLVHDLKAAEQENGLWLGLGYRHITALSI